MLSVRFLARIPALSALMLRFNRLAPETRLIMMPVPSLEISKRFLIVTLFTSVRVIAPLPVSVKPFPSKIALSFCRVRQPFMSPVRVYRLPFLVMRLGFPQYRQHE